MKEQIWRLGSSLFGLFCVVGCLVGVGLNGFTADVIGFCIVTAGILVVTVLQNFGYTAREILLAKYLCVILYALEYFAVRASFYRFELGVFLIACMIAVGSVICLVLEWNLFREGILPEKPLRETAGQVAAVVYTLSYLYPIFFFGGEGLLLVPMGFTVLTVVDLALFLSQGYMRCSRAMTVLRYVGNAAALLFGLSVWCLVIFRELYRNSIIGLIWLAVLFAVHLVCFLVELKFPFGEGREAIKKTPSAISD